jgi:nucleotide-binding universal stress UspA family protein
MKIVVGHHDTPEGRAALERAVELARERGGQLHLVSLVPLPKNSEEAERYERTRAQRESELQAVAEDYVTAGIDAHAQVPNGVQRPADALLSVARIEKADLIVIGMRRRSRVGKLVLGSTAQEVLLDADCEVLSVKAPASE